MRKGNLVSCLLLAYVCVCAFVLTSCERPPADGSRPLSLGRLSLGELHPETGVLLLLGDESVDKRAKISTDYFKKKVPYNSFHRI